MKLGMYIMASDPIPMAYFICPSHQSACLYVHPSYHCYATAQKPVSVLLLLGNISVNTFLQQRMHATIKELLNLSFSTLSLSYQKESLWVWCIPLYLLGNSSVKTLQQQRRIIGTIIFDAFHVVLKEIRWLVLPRSSCSFISLSHQVFMLYIS
jgi:hypothetical protein